MNKIKYVCITPCIVRTLVQKGELLVSLEIGSIVYLEPFEWIPGDEQFISYAHASDLASTYLGYIEDINCFITQTEWRELQINKILE